MVIHAPHIGPGRTGKNLHIFGFPEVEIQCQLTELFRGTYISLIFYPGRVSINDRNWTIFVRVGDRKIDIPEDLSISFCDSITIAGQTAFLLQKMGRTGMACSLVGDGSLYMASFSKGGTYSVLARPEMAALPDNLRMDGEENRGKLLWFSAIFLLAAGDARTLLEGADMARRIYGRGK